MQPASSIAGSNANAPAQRAKSGRTVAASAGAERSRTAANIPIRHFLSDLVLRLPLPASRAGDLPLLSGLVPLNFALYSLHRAQQRAIRLQSTG
jgi:hypothetical protein